MTSSPKDGGWGWIQGQIGFEAGSLVTEWEKDLPPKQGEGGGEGYDVIP